MRDELPPNVLRCGQKRGETIEAYRARITKAQREWNKSHPGYRAKKLREKRERLRQEGRCPECSCPARGCCEPHLPDAVLQMFASQAKSKEEIEEVKRNEEVNGPVFQAALRKANTPSVS